MCGRTQFGGSGPGDIGFDNHHIAFGNEPGHTAGGFEKFSGQGSDITRRLAARSLCDKPTSCFCSDSRKRRRYHTVKNSTACQTDELSSVDEQGVCVQFFSLTFYAYFGGYFFILRYHTTDGEGNRHVTDDLFAQRGVHVYLRKDRHPRKISQVLDYLRMREKIESDSTKHWLVIIA
jgi:hypothetical protein